jgi:2-polyprenyl-6-methoxyphenol hydroxylase-like FAD-dependent oxidoreductase
MLQRVSGTNVRLKSVQVATSYTDRARQATTYRKDRILLAGDAAHVHSPFGGQGMNTGLGDAMNLGWKLAATIKGWGPDDLFDTYTAERHPIGAWVLNWTRAGSHPSTRSARESHRFRDSRPDRYEGGYELLCREDIRHFHALRF